MSRPFRPYALGFVLSLGMLLALVSCAGFPTQAAFTAQKPEDIRVEIGKKGAGSFPARVTIAGFSGAVLNGTAALDPQGNWVIGLSSLKWFNNWPNGWTDADFLIEGGLTLVRSEGGWTLRVDRKPAIDAVDSASMRYFDEDLVGDRGLEEFSHRWDRIVSAVGFLSQRFPKDWIEQTDAVRSFLFPEVYGYPSDVVPGKKRVTADSIDWDTAYTTKVFPQNLRAVRDGGTLFRDFQESPGLWTLAYRWPSFWDRAAAAVFVEDR